MKIPAYSSMTAPSNNDLLVIEDTVVGNTKKITRNAFFTGTPLPANTVDAQAVQDGALPTSKLTNPYKARAFASVDQTGITDTVATTITFGGESYDVNGNFASNGYTAPLTGYYQVNASVRINGNSNGVSFRLDVLDDSTEKASVINTPYPATTTYGSMNMAYSDILHITAGHKITFKVYGDVASGTVTIQGNAGGTLTWCSFHLLSL